MKNVAVVLCGTKEPGNLGAAARAMRNFGAETLVLVNPRCEPLDGAARATSAGAAEILREAICRDSIGEALAPFHLSIALTGMAGRQRPLDCIDPLPAKLLPKDATERRIALVFGSEDNGLTVEESTACMFRWRLPTDPDFPSLNLAQAVGIALFALSQSIGASTPSSVVRESLGRKALRSPGENSLEDALASTADIERLLATTREAMLEAGYRDDERTANSVLLLRQLAGRTSLSLREVNFLLGVLRQLRRKGLP